MINKVEICGVNTAKLPVLSNEEKEALFIEIKNGDEKAREKFIHGNLRLVLSVIKRFYGKGITRRCVMTILRQSAMRELERLPEDKITFVLQIMRGINGLDEDERLAKKNAFKRLEHLRKKADINENDELKRYREEKYGR